MNLLNNIMYGMSVFAVLMVSLTVMRNEHKKQLMIVSELLFVTAVLIRSNRKERGRVRVQKALQVRNKKAHYAMR